MTTRSTTSKLGATLGLALLISAFGLFAPVFLPLGSPISPWTVTQWSAYAAIVLASFVGSWRFGLNPLLGLVVGYFLGWFNLVLINGQISLNVYRQSPGAFLVLFLIAPLSFAIVGLAAAVPGWLARKFFAMMQ